jgi:hypothetical protein
MAALSAYLSYRDAPAAIDWLEAIGFRVVTRQPGDGAVLHAELSCGDAVVMLATADADYTIQPRVGNSTGSGLYLLVEDVAAIFRAAVGRRRNRTARTGDDRVGHRAPASSTPRVTSGRSAPTSPAAIGKRLGRIAAQPESHSASRTHVRNLRVTRHNPAPPPTP